MKAEKKKNHNTQVSKYAETECFKNTRLPSQYNIQLNCTMGTFYSICHSSDCCTYYTCIRMCHNMKSLIIINPVLPVALLPSLSVILRHLLPTRKTLALKEGKKSVGKISCQDKCTYTQEQGSSSVSDLRQ